jgi:hypothetical protein
MPPGFGHQHRKKDERRESNGGQEQKSGGVAEILDDDVSALSEGRNMQKSAIEEIKELKAQLESKTEQAKTEALDRANEAIGFLRELGIDNDTILKELGFRGRAKAQESREGSPPKEDVPCPICNFRTDPPHDGRSHRGQTKKKPFTSEELEQKGLTKV